MLADKHKTVDKIVQQEGQKTGPFSVRYFIDGQYLNPDMITLAEILFKIYLSMAVTIFRLMPRAVATYEAVIILHRS